MSPAARAGCLAPALLSEASKLSMKIFLTPSAEDIQVTQEVCKLPPHQPAVRANLSCMSGTIVLINCLEVCSPAQDKEEKMLCDLCVVKKKPN